MIAYLWRGENCIFRFKEFQNMHISQVITQYHKSWKITIFPKVKRYFTFFFSLTNDHLLKKEMSTIKLEDTSHFPLIKDPHFYLYIMVIWKKMHYWKHDWKILMWFLQITENHWSSFWEWLSNLDISVLCYCLICLIISF